MHINVNRFSNLHFCAQLPVYFTIICWIIVSFCHPEPNLTWEIRVLSTGKKSTGDLSQYMTTKVKRGQNEENERKEQSHWGKTEGINTQITSGLIGTENMSVWTWYGRLITWKFATPAGKNTGGGWWPPNDKKPFEAVQAACVVSSGSRSCQSPWCPWNCCCCCWMYVREHQPLPQHNIPSFFLLSPHKHVAKNLIQRFLFYFQKKSLSSFLSTSVIDIQQPWAHSQ